MNKKRLIVAGVMVGSIISLSLCGCENDTTKSSRYTSSEFIKYGDWSVKQYKEKIDVLSATYNKERESINKLIDDHLQRQDSDIHLMNERYSYWQNITREKLPKR
jgi:hypothetical protein